MFEKNKFILESLNQIIIAVPTQAGNAVSPGNIEFSLIKKNDNMTVVKAIIDNTCLKTPFNFLSEGKKFTAIPIINSSDRAGKEKYILEFSPKTLKLYSVYAKRIMNMQIKLATLHRLGIIITINGKII